MNYKTCFYILVLLFSSFASTAQKLDSIEISIKNIVSPSSGVKLEYGHERIDISSPIVGTSYLLFLDKKKNTIFLLNRKNNLIEDKLELKSYRKKENLEWIEETESYIDISISQIDDSTIYAGLVSRTNDIYFLLLNLVNGKIQPEIKPIPTLSQLPPEVPKTKEPKLRLNGYYRQNNTECFVFNFFHKDNQGSVYSTYTNKTGKLELLEYNKTELLMSPTMLALDSLSILSYNRFSGIVKRYEINSSIIIDTLATQKNGNICKDIVSRQIYLAKQQMIDGVFHTNIFEIHGNPCEESAVLTVESDTRIFLQAVHGSTAYFLIKGIEANSVYLYGLNLKTYNRNIAIIKNYKE